MTSDGAIAYTTYVLLCKDIWVITQRKEESYTFEKWMSGYMECVEKCTGEKSFYWGKDRPVGDSPNV